jgi:hypothetical protein
VFRAFPAPALVPWPRSILAKAEYVLMSSLKTINAGAGTWPLAQLLQAQIRGNMDGVALVASNSSNGCGASSIQLKLSAAVFMGEASAFTVDDSGVFASAGTYDALVGASVTLLQALEFYSADFNVGPDNNNRSESNFSGAVDRCHTLPAWRPSLLAYRGLSRVPQIPRYDGGLRTGRPGDQD